MTHVENERVVSGRVGARRIKDSPGEAPGENDAAVNKPEVRGEDGAALGGKADVFAVREL